MKKAIPFVIALGAAVLVGCGGESEATAEPEAETVSEETVETKLATSLEDVVGTWQGIKGNGDFIQIEGDGAWTLNHEPDAFEGEAHGTSEVRFEGMQFLITEIVHNVGTGEICANTGIYEVQLLESGNLRFVAIEDECEPRVNALQGSAADGINVEYKPVP